MFLFQLSCVHTNQSSTVTSCFCFLSFLSLLALLGIDLESQSIPLKEKLQEQEEVANVHDKNSSVVFKGSPASFPSNDQKGKDGNGSTDDHLSNLGNGDPFGVEPLGFAFDGHQKVVKVHDGVDSICGKVYFG